MKKNSIKKSIFYLMLVGLFTCNNLMSMNIVGFDLEVIKEYSEFEIALKHNNQESMKSIIEDYKKSPEKCNKDCFIAAIEYNNAEIFDELLQCAEQIYGKNKIVYAESLINLFLDVVKRMMIIIKNDLVSDLDFLADEKTIYTFLEKFFDVIQRMGYNPFTLASKNGYTPAIHLLGMYDTIYDKETCTVQDVKPNKFLDKVIHYFIEVGVPIYANENANKCYGCCIVEPKTLFERASDNPEMQNYIKLIGRYNKRLFNANESIANIEVLKKFITKLQSEEQYVIFRLAATRGHMKPLVILGKLDDKYTLIEAVKLATKRRLTPIVVKYCNSLVDDVETMNTIEKTLDKHDKKFFLDCENMQFEQLKEDFKSVKEDQLMVVSYIIKKHCSIMNPKEFDALVNEFRKKY